AQRLAAAIAPGARVLVLGTGEFMHPPTLLGAALERHGVNVVVQSTTRSPILTWGAVATSLSFPDNYGEGVGNYLYNVRPHQYDHVLICHETAPNAALFQLARLLDARLFHFITEIHVEEVSEIPVC
ncbi:MAG TPA: TRSP domain-containing protein, partial [Telluria sp.]